MLKTLVLGMYFLNLTIIIFYIFGKKKILTFTLDLN